MHPAEFDVIERGILSKAEVLEFSQKSLRIEGFSSNTSSFGLVATCSSKLTLEAISRVQESHMKLDVRRTVFGRLGVLNRSTHQVGLSVGIGKSISQELKTLEITFRVNLKSKRKQCELLSTIHLAFNLINSMVSTYKRKSSFKQSSRTELVGWDKKLKLQYG